MLNHWDTLCNGSYEYLDLDFEESGEKEYWIQVVDSFITNKVSNSHYRRKRKKRMERKAKEFFNKVFV